MNRTRRPATSPSFAALQDLTPGLASRIEGTVLKALTTGTLHEDLARQLQERAFGYAEQRAELIAVDQIAKVWEDARRRPMSAPRHVNQPPASRPEPTRVGTIGERVRCPSGRRRFATERTATMYRMPGSAELCALCHGWHQKRRSR